MTSEVGDVDLEDEAAVDAALGEGRQLAVSTVDMPEWMIREFEVAFEEQRRKAGGDLVVDVDPKGT